MNKFKKTPWNIKRKKFNEEITVRYYDSVSGVTYGGSTQSTQLEEVRSYASPLFLSRAIRRYIKKISISEKSRIEQQIDDKVCT